MFRPSSLYIKPSKNKYPQYSLETLRQNAVQALSERGYYLYAGERVDAVMGFCESFTAEGYVATKYAHGVYVARVDAPPSADLVNFLNGTLTPEAYRKSGFRFQLDV